MLERMLTRSQVANRIGRSISTVRRLEGELLRPVVTARGVHLFHERDVDDLVEKMRTGLRLPCGFQPISGPPRNDLSRRVAKLEEQVALLSEGLSLLLDSR